MLKDNLKTARETKGLSQEQLAAQLHVVRQTVSKWERGSSIPDARMLVKIAKTLDTPVNALLDETTSNISNIALDETTPDSPSNALHDENLSESEANSLKVLSEKLEKLSQQQLQKQNRHRKILRGTLISLFIVTILVLVLLFFLKSPYLNWDYNNPETAILEVLIHSLEWTFIRLAPIILILLIVAIVLTKRKS